MKEISILTSVFAFSSTLVLLALLILFVLIGKKKYRGAIRSFFGAIFTYLAAFILIVVIWNVADLSNVLDKLLSAGSDDRTFDIILINIRAVFMVLVETAAMFVYFKWISRKQLTFGNAWIFCVWYGFCSIAVMLLLLTLTCVTIVLNAAGTSFSFQFPFAKLFVTTDQVSGAESIGFLVYGIENALELIFFIAASVQIFVAAKQKLIWPVITVLILHSMLDIPPLLCAENVWFWGNAALVEVTGAIVTVIACLLAYKLFSDYYRESYRHDGEKTNER